MRQPPVEFSPSPGVTTPGQFGPINRVLRAAHGLLHLHHVIDRDAFGDGHDQIQRGIRRFQDRVRGEGRRNKNGGNGRAGLAGGLGHRVEDRDFFAGMFKDLAPLARRDPGHDLRAVIERELRVPGAETARDPLHENLGLGSDKDGHDKIYDFKQTLCCSDYLKLNKYKIAAQPLGRRSGAPGNSRPYLTAIFKKKCA